jgi:excisionase family DNA binding protein
MIPDIKKSCADNLNRLINIDELSLMLGVAKNTLYDWCALRKIPYYKLGKLTKFKVEEIEEWLAEKKRSVNTHPN